MHGLRSLGTIRGTSFIGLRSLHKRRYSGEERGGSSVGTTGLELCIYLCVCLPLAMSNGEYVVVR